MNNIERFELLKELHAKKAELHKESFLSRFEFGTSSNSQDSTMDKIVSYGKTGYALYQLFQKMKPSDK